MEFGLFLNTNQYAGLYVREIVSCLSPVARIFNVPQDEPNLKAIVSKAFNAKIGRRYGEFSLLPIYKYPCSYCSFGLAVDWNEVLFMVESQNESDSGDFIC